MRLDKFLAEASVGSRKAVRNLVKEGQISVNNQILKDPAIEVNEELDVIAYLGNKVIHAGKVYYMFHKPSGCVTAKKDDRYKTVLDYFDNKTRENLFPVGRLDKDTEGLLLLTNDGDFNNKLMSPNKGVEKTYFFWVLGTLSPENIDKLKKGIMIEEGRDLAKAVEVIVIEEGMYHDYSEKINMEYIRDINFNPNIQRIVSGTITITEGRKHQVKRMLKAVGCYVIYLKRISIGGLILDEMLDKGQYRELTDIELNSILKS